MHPILFRIPLPSWNFPVVGQMSSLPIYSYGVMLGLSFVVGWYLTLALAERDGLPRETMANNYVITAVCAVVAARLLYVVTNLEEFGSLGDILSMRSGGLVAYGGFLGGFLGSWSYLRLKRIRLLPWADVAVPSLASGLMITRIGCYLFGCDYGGTLTAEAPAWLKSLGTFPRWDEATLPGSSGSPAWVRHQELGLIDASTTSSLPVHPTQIYESLLGLSLLVLLLWARRRQSFRGQIFLLFTFAYGVGRFLLEMVRDDPERGTVPPSLPEHILLPLCLALFAGGYAISVSRLIDSERARRISQALAFLPALALVIALRPENFAGPALMALSTSQFIGLASGVAACGAYFVFDRAALAHPETAMSLDLPSDLVEESPESNSKRKSEAAPNSDPETDAGSDPPRAEPEDDEDDGVGRAEADDEEAAGSDDEEAARDS